MREHIAWSSDTQAISGMVAYQHGTTGNLDAVTDGMRQAILSDPALGLAGQTVSGAPAFASSTDQQAETFY